MFKIDIDYTTRTLLRRLLVDHVKPYSSKILLAILFMILSAASNAVIVRLVQPAIDNVFLTHERSMLILIPLVVFGVSLVKGTAEYFQGYLIKFVGQKILTDLQMLMYRHLLRSDLEVIQAQSAGRLISRFTNDISMMRGAVSNLLVGFAKHFLSILFLVGLMFQLEPRLSIFVFFVFPLALYPMQKLGRRMRRVSFNTQEELGNYTAKLDETFTSIKVVKSYLCEELEVSRAESMVNKIFNLYRKAAKLDSLTSPIMECLSGLAVASIIWYGGAMVIDGETTAGSLFAFITAFVSAYRPYKSLAALNVNLQEGLAASKRVFQVLDTKPLICDHDNALDVHFGVADIFFQKVSLFFGEKIALRNVTFKIESGKTIALVGQSGGGKTSITNLLVRFYEPTEGDIYIGNYNIHDIKLASLRKQIALITQDVMLFDSTIADNISYGNAEASHEEIIEAAKKAAAHDFIMQLPKGYETMVGAQGVTLSGGQRQRISIARAFLKDAPILIMDEATSALDTKSDAIIQSAVQLLRQNRTTIIITHRLQTIIDSDQIIVFKDGEILEQGTHDELISSKKEYYHLFLAQQQNTNI